MLKLIDEYYVWPKGYHILFSTNFSTTEFECRCTHKTCTEQRISTTLIEKLQLVREALNSSITITSGYRCSAHQRDLVSGGEVETVKKSQHELGNAADLKVAKVAQTKIMSVLAKYFDAIGIAPTWFHIDERIGYRRWRYKK